MIRVVICDDQALVRGGLRRMLDAQPDIEVVGEAEDGQQAVRASARLRPHVVLMDIRMPGIDGIEATRQVLAGAPGGLRVLVLTTFDEDQYVYDALRERPRGRSPGATWPAPGGRAPASPGPCAGGPGGGPSRAAGRPRVG